MTFSIGMVSYEYPPYIHGGPGTVTWNLTHALSDLKVKVTVFCGGEAKPAISEENEYLRIVRLPIIRKPPQFIWFQLKNIKMLIEGLKGCDLIYGQTESSTFCAFVKEKLQKKWISGIHGIPKLDLKTLVNAPLSSWSFGDILQLILGFPVRETLLRLEMKYADHCIVSSFSCLHDLSQLYNIRKFKFTVIPNGVYFKEIDQLSLEFSEEKHSSPTIICGGRLCWGKGLEYLVKAMPHVQKEHRDVQLKVIGTGPSEIRLRSLAIKLGLRNHISFLGFVPRNQFLSELAKGDLAVFPSLYEAGTSNAVLEAMALRKPVVAFKYPFMNEVVADGWTGLLVPPQDSVKLAEGISSLLSDSSLRNKMGVCAHEHVKRNFNCEILAEKHIQLFERLLQ